MLDRLGIGLGTDKGSIGNDYLTHYDHHFSALRDSTFNLLEIGVASGASLKMWESYFSNAKIIGLDIDERCRRFATDRTSIEIGSQADPGFLDTVGARYRPFIIIDDGSHLAAHNMLTFGALFGHLRAGGFYVIEDIHLHDTDPASYRVGSDEVPADFFIRMARRLAAEDAGAVQEAAEDGALLGEIASIEFVRRAIIIRKRRDIDPVNLVEEVWPLVAEAGDSHLWHTLSSYMLRNGLDLDRAADATRHSIATNPSAAAPRIRLASIFERQGKSVEALEAARQAAAIDPDDNGLQRYIKQLEEAVAASVDAST